MNFNILLYDDFEALDAFGPAEIIGRMPPEIYDMEFFSMKGGLVASTQIVKTQTLPISAMNPEGVLLIPGGIGARTLVHDTDFIAELAALVEKAPFVLTVCTGSALLAKTGLIDAKKATSNKRAFDWVRSVNETVDWVKQARWVADGRFYTASGVSAGMDMTLGFIKDQHGRKMAMEVADFIEYVWSEDKNIDPFCR